jgi:hypothetical protein
MTTAAVQRPARVQPLGRHSDLKDPIRASYGHALPETSGEA